MEYETDIYFVQLQPTFGTEDIVNPFSNKIITPYLDTDTKSIAWQKFYNGTGKLIIIHVRKAGGSTLKTWMIKLFKRMKRYYNNTHQRIWNCTMETYEFWSYAHGTYMNNQNKIDEIVKNNPYAIYVIGFRDPIERILSQYQFEWRWGCVHCNTESEMYFEQHLDLNSSTFIKVYKNAKFKRKWWRKQYLYNYSVILESKYDLENVHKYKVSNIELDDLLKKVNIFQNIYNQRIKWKIAFNAYLHNYYLWIFCCNSKHCNIEKNFVAKGIINKCIKHAKKMIISFDIVLIDEWMNDKRTEMYVNKLLLGDINITNYTYVSMNDAYNKPNKKPLVNKRGKNVMIHHDVANKLMKWNKFDLKFYSFIKRLVFQRESKIWNQYGDVLKYNITV